MKTNVMMYKAALAFVILISSVISSTPAFAFHEGWESSLIGIYLPTTHDTLPLPTILADEGEWLLGDTVSEFPECGSTPHTAEILQTASFKLLRLTSNDSNSDCADNIYISLFEVPLLNMNPGFSVPLIAGTNISFEETGDLINPALGSHSCIGPPCGDTVALLLEDSNGNTLAYVLQRADGAVPNTNYSFYREILLDPEAGTYHRNLFADFSTIPDFNATNAEIVSVEFGVDEHGSANIDNICIGTTGCGQFVLVTIPDVVGLTQTNAEATIQSAGLTVGNITFQSSSLVPAGSVISQTPEAGVQVVYGARVDLVVSLGMPDSDNDGLPDAYENLYIFLNPQDETDAALDQDSDGLTNLQEYLAGTLPDDEDSDNDGLPDGYETQYAFLDPQDDTDASLDQDSDGLSNLDEYISGTLPDNPDSDADGRIDGLDSEPLIPSPNLCGGDNVVLINDVYPNGTVFDCRAQISIQTDGTVTVESGADVLYMAPVLRLDTGFRVEAGGVFHAVGATTVAP